MVGPDGGERSVEMSFDGADRQARDVGDLGEFQLFEKAKKKDAALPV